MFFIVSQTSGGAGTSRRPGREKQWVKRFTRAARPGAYLRIVTLGDIQAGDDIEVVSRPAHEVSVELLLQAMTTERDPLSTWPVCA